METNVYHGNFDFNGYKFNFMATTGNGQGICWKTGEKNICAITIRTTWLGEECSIIPLTKHQIKSMKDFITKCEKRYK